MTTHAADGLYYLTYYDLVKGNACYSAKKDWKKEFGIDAEVPVTYELALHASRRSNSYSLGWAAARMLDNDRITPKECKDFTDIYWFNDKPRVDALVFMNLLEQRAKREGRLP